MSNRTEVINRALVKIGANTIASPDEDSEQARKAALVFSTLVQGELRRQAWSFAKKRATLAPLAVNPGAPDFGAGYNLPADCLRLITLNGNWIFSSIREQNAGAPASYAIEGRVLLSGVGQRTNGTTVAQITYVSDASALVSLWDSTFVEMIACRLANELTQTITKNLSLKQSLQSDYALALKEAKRTNAIELPPVSIDDDSWVLSRYW